MSSSHFEHRQRPQWMGIQPDIKNHKGKTTYYHYINKSSSNHPTMQVGNILIGPMYVNDKGLYCDRSILQHNHNRNGFKYYKGDARVQNEYMYVKNGNTTKSKSMSSYNKHPSSYSMEIVSASLSSDSSISKTHRMNQQLNLKSPPYNHSYLQHQNSSKINSLSSTIEHDVFSDEDVKSRGLGRLRHDIETTTGSNTHPTSQIHQQHTGTTSTTLPIKGILKSSSQSSHSSFANECGSDGDATASTKLSSVESKVLFKKKVHFEDAITNFTKKQMLDSDSLDKTQSKKLTDYFRTEKCMNKITFPNDICSAEKFAKGDIFHRPSVHLNFRENIQDVSYRKSHNVANGLILDKVCSLRNEAYKTVFPCPPISKLSNFQPNGAEEKRSSNNCGQTNSINGDTQKHDNNMELGCSKYSLDYPRSKSIQHKSLNTDEKTQRILEWLNTVETNENPEKHSASLFVIPRPTLRRLSFVGE